MAKIRGVNLGNWLVLEKWMHPDLFAGTTAEDETELCWQLGDEKYARLKAHRDTYITRADFEYIAQKGMNTIRIPVPHFIFDDCEPYVGCIEYLDQAFVWAKETGLKILIDLHTARDSQNGFDNGGICGVCKWHLKAENIDHTLSVLEKLAIRYQDDPALYGIELLNEPTTPEMFAAQQAQKRYPPHDPVRAEGSCGVPDGVLRDFYTRAYHLLRRHLRDDIVIMFHDGFRLKHWKDFMQSPEFVNVVLDTHLYLAFSAAPGQKFADLLPTALDTFLNDIREMSQFFPIVVGEWCFAFPASAAEDDDSPLAVSEMIRAASACQLYAFEKAHGWFFWSYKLISSPQGWDARRAFDNGWFPATVSD